MVGEATSPSPATSLPEAIAKSVPGALQTLERCCGQRLLLEQRLATAVSEAASEAPQISEEVKEEMESLKEQNKQLIAAAGQISEEAKKELESIKDQNKQLLAVVACQATTIEQTTSGSGNASQRE
eukprot:5496676-Amphidinium_carterae.1